jgi:hypothetical protein
MMTRLTALVCLVAFTLAVGCGDGGPVPRTVEGKVTYAGKPLDHGMIMFQPDKGRLASAGLQPDGHYSVSLAPGNYSVFLNAPPKLPEGFREGDPIPPPDPNALPGKYSQKESSGLAASVEAGSGVQTVNFVLQ